MKKNKTILQRQIIESVRFMSSTDDLSKGSTKTNTKIASLFLSM